MSITLTKYVEVEVDVDLEDEIDSMSEKDKARIASKLSGICLPFGLGDGDASRVENMVERAYLAARQMPQLPREIADLFWHVHGRAL